MTSDDASVPAEAPFTPVDPRGAVLGDEVYSILGRAILEGRLHPGERLRDVDLAERLGVSRTPVREALQRLERFGLVEVAANRWTRVSTPAASAAQETQEFMAFLVGGAFALALTRCTDDELTTMLAAADGMSAASEADDMDAILATTVIFFQQIIRATGNSVFVTIMREAGLALQRNLRGWTHEITDVAARTAQYRLLRDAVAMRDAALAERTLRALHGFG